VWFLIQLLYKRQSNTHYEYTLFSVCLSVSYTIIAMWNLNFTHWWWINLSWNFSHPLISICLSLFVPNILVSDLLYKMKSCGMWLYFIAQFVKADRVTVCSTKGHVTGCPFTFINHRRTERHSTRVQLQRCLCTVCLSIKISAVLFCMSLALLCRAEREDCYRRRDYRISVVD
jgi:hypothetical protein